MAESTTGKHPPAHGSSDQSTGRKRDASEALLYLAIGMACVFVAIGILWRGPDPSAEAPVHLAVAVVFGLLATPFLLAGAAAFWFRRKKAS